MNSARTSTPIDAVAEEYVVKLCRLRPEIATELGRSEGNDRWADYSPEGLAALADLNARTIDSLRLSVPVDQVDEVTRTDLLANLESSQREIELGIAASDLNVIWSPFQQMRETFDLMPQRSREDWQNIRERLRQMPKALISYQRTLQSGVKRGMPAARRQALEVAVQAERAASEHGALAQLSNSCEIQSDEFLAGIQMAADTARQGCAQFAQFLRNEYAPQARVDDAVGREIYAVHSERFLGMNVDLDETYEWGLAELARTAEAHESLAKEIAQGSVQQAEQQLDADPRYLLRGTQELTEWMQSVSDAAVEELGHTEFHIPEQIRQLECRIAPSQDGGIYYTAPSEDFSRPGQMWWSVPVGIETFSTWRETTTVYHEGVPGHHLQIGQAMLQQEFNAWRRSLAGSSGHAEGWALYAESLMADLGYLDDPGDRFGMLAAQRMRAARVVLDIGLHLGKPSPYAPRPWSAEDAFRFFPEHTSDSPEVARFEVLRYLGYPGQAPSYKVGQRIWMRLREQAEQRGETAQSFHARALALGGVRLDTLVESLSPATLAP